MLGGTRWLVRGTQDKGGEGKSSVLRHQACWEWDHWARDRKSTAGAR